MRWNPLLGLVIVPLFLGCSDAAAPSVDDAQEEHEAFVEPADVEDVPDLAETDDPSEVDLADDGVDLASGLPLGESTEGTDAEDAVVETGDALAARKPLLKAGLHPGASDALRALKVPASRIVQTIGNAPASAGTHARDGFVNGRAYGAAVDISVRGLSTRRIRTLILNLGKVGFAGWYRQPGHDGWPSREAPHIHAVWTGCRMKSSLRRQVASWLQGRNGLVSNTRYRFAVWPLSTRRAVRARFLRHNH